LDHNNYKFISRAFSYLDERDLWWTEYYHLGRMEEMTPLRFILSNASLKFAYYTGMITLLIFILFEIKRKQRAIPIINPPENSSLEFAETVGRLYYHQGDHKNIALKKINFLADHIRSTYHLNGDFSDPEFCIKLSQKSGKEESKLRELFDMIMHIKTQYKIDAPSLWKLTKSVEWFYTKKEI
jgi:hypothetical protein